MSPVAQRQPPGTIGICASDTARFTAFAASLAGIASPPGSQIAWAVGSDIAEGRELLVTERLHGDWMWFMDDDHAFVSDVLGGLLDRNLDVVAPLCLMRQKPFLPTAKWDEESTVDLTRRQSGTSLLRVHATGTAGMLIRRSVFSRIKERWPNEPIFGKKMGVSDDYLFCEKLRELDIPIWLDLDQRLGHMTTTVVWPDTLDDGQQLVTFQISDSFTVSVGYEKG